MAENDTARKPHFPRRNLPQRPLPGVQKALNNFGVPDLRQFLDKKHKEQGESLGEKPIDPKKVPPPDPSYNYLRDPARDKPRAPQQPRRGDNRKPYVPRPKNHENAQIGNDNSTEETTDNEYQKTTGKSSFRGRYPRRGNSNFSRDSQSTLENVDNQNESLGSNFRGNSTEETIDNENGKTSGKPTFIRGRYHRRGSSNFSRDNQSTSELEDNANESSSPNFRGRSPRRGRGTGKPRTKDHPENITDLLNIKIEFSSKTGQRSCVLDEDTKIPDIKHVPDHESIRGSPRRGRGSFRGRSRGNYRGRGGLFTNKNKASENNDEVTEEVNESNAEAIEEAQGNENEFSSEYHDDSEEQAQPAISTFDSNLTETITVTSSNFQDGDVERLVEVKLENGENSEEKNIINE